MYLWRRLVPPRWFEAHETELETDVGQRLAIIEHASRKQLRLEVVCETRPEAQSLVRRYGGSVEKIPADWLQRFSRAQKTAPLKAGKRLIITRDGQISASGRSPRQGASHLVIPAGVAFGTGDHATTAMSLRFLEEITRNWGAHAPGVPVSAPRRKPFPLGEVVARGAQRSTRGRVRSPERKWSLVDLGTGSGILALAGRRLGAGRVFAVEKDPLALATAKENARLNKVDKIGFREADVRYWRPPGKIDIVVANLFSELVMETLPNLRRYMSAGARLILSGILQKQEREVVRALYSHKFGVLEVRRRGKWIAILAAVA